MALSVKQSLLLLALLASSPALTQGNTGYVDGASSCIFRTGDKTCPFRKIGEGVKRVSPGGALLVRGGSYIEPVLLNKAMQIQAYDGVATIIGPSPLAPFDLVTDTGENTHWWVDDNLLPLNPKWGTQPPNPTHCPVKTRKCPTPKCWGQSKHYSDPAILPCSNQFTYENNSYLCGPHVNWFGATYSGTIFWESRSCGFSVEHPDDYDYNMNLTPDDNAGLATTRDKLHAEFDLRETIEHFTSDKNAWWSKFHKAVQDDVPTQQACRNKGSQPGPRATGMIGENGSRAIVTALMGFDTDHDTFPELHPVWALAMSVGASHGNVAPFPIDDVWVFFVRNSGNEGFCGGDQEFIDFPNNWYTVRLPWRPGATSVTVTESSFHPYHTQNPGPSEEDDLIRIVPGQGVFVTFLLDPPKQDGSMWDGELHLHWIGQN
jgi:hypothetical protein